MIKQTGPPENGSEDERGLDNMVAKKKKVKKRKKKPESTPKEKNGKPKGESKQKSVLEALLALLVKLFIIALILYVAVNYVFGVFRLSGNNMYPMLKDGDLCITYRLETYHSNDVVAYRIGGSTRFGRIVAWPGDTVDGDEQGILINGLYPSEEVFYPTDMLGADLDMPVTLGEGQYLILNDYREDFSDSRFYGLIEKRDLQGKVIFIFRRRGF